MTPIDKEEALNYIKLLAQQRVVTKNELETAFNSGSGVNPETDQSITKKLGISEILYYIGGAIIFLGIAVLIFMFWSSFSNFTKVLVTLGSGVAAYIVGVLFGRDDRTKSVASAFFLISALVIPLGLEVVFYQSGFNLSTPGTQSLISGILLTTYLLSFALFRKEIFALFSILFGSWFFSSIANLLVEGQVGIDYWQFYQYLIWTLGCSYILLGYSFTKTKLSSLQGFLYGFGILGFLGAAYTLGGWGSSKNTFWELIYPGLVFGSLFLSVYLKNQSFLTWGTIFLMLYILKITGEYFTNSFGWPFALILAGLMMIGVGQMSLSFKKKYLSAN